MDGVRASAGYLRYWAPDSLEEVGRSVVDLQDVLIDVAAAVELYRNARVDFIPGLALWLDAETPENSLSIGVADDGWAVIHTDAEFDQRVTRGAATATAGCRLVKFDESLELPSACFITNDVAAELIGRWFEDPELQDAAVLSSDLFST